MNTNMMKYLALLVVVTISGFGIFGFATIGHSGGHSADCVASLINNTVCPDSLEAMALHHAQAFTSFFNSIPTNAFTLIFALLAILLLYSAHIIARIDKIKLLVRGLQLFQLEAALAQARRRIMRWLALFENSPSFA